MSYPICLVDIYGRDEQWTMQAELDPRQPYGASTGTDLVSCRTVKHLHFGHPEGRFWLTLAHRPDGRGRTWADRLRPQDLVVIQLQHYGQPSGPHGQGQLHTVMIGLVTTISFIGGVNPDGTPQRQILVTGSDFGKLFIRSNVTFWSFAGASLLGVAEFILPHLLNDQPHVVAKRLLTELFFKFMQPSWVFENQTVTFEDVLGYAMTSYQSEFPGGLDWQFLLSEQAFWSFFVKVASIPFHELYLDTRRVSDMQASAEFQPLSRVPRTTEAFTDASGVSHLSSTRAEAGSLVHLPQKTYGQDQSSPFVIMRQPPFPELGVGGATVNMTPWENLPNHVVSLDDAGFESSRQHLTRSDQELFNFYLIFPRGGVLGEFQYLLNVPPLIDLARFRRFGYRPLMPQVSLLQYPSKAAGDPWLTFYSNLQWKLAGWNLLNDEYWSGPLTYPLLPHVHIGERLTDQSTWVTAPGSQGSGRQFYIESVQHEFITNQRASTTIGATRGLSVPEATVYDSLLRGRAGELTEIGTDVRQFYVDRIKKGLVSP